MELTTDTSRPEIGTTSKVEQGTQSIASYVASAKFNNMLEKQMIIPLGEAGKLTEMAYSQKVVLSIDQLFSMQFEEIKQTHAQSGLFVWEYIVNNITPSFMSISDTGADSGDIEKIKSIRVAAAVCNNEILYASRVPTSGAMSMKVKNDIKGTFLMQYIPPLQIPNRILIDSSDVFITRTEVLREYKKIASALGDSVENGFFYIIFDIGTNEWSSTSVDYIITPNKGLLAAIEENRRKPQESRLTLESLLISHPHTMSISKTGLDKLFALLKVPTLDTTRPSSTSNTLHYSDRLELTLGASVAALNILGNNLLQDTSIILGALGFEGADIFIPCVYFYDFGITTQLALPGLRHIEEVSLYGREKRRTDEVSKRKAIKKMQTQTNTRLFPQLLGSLIEFRDTAFKQNKQRMDYENANFVLGYNYALTVIEKVLSDMYDTAPKSSLLKANIPFEYISGMKLSTKEFGTKRVVAPESVSIIPSMATRPF